MSWAKDIINRFSHGRQIPEVYMVPHSLTNPLVGIVKRPLTADRVTCSYVLVTAGLSNQGIIYIGGQELNVNNGIELDGGRGILFTATLPLSPQQLMGGNLGSSMLANISAMNLNISEVQGAINLMHIPMPVLNLADFFVVASVADQQMRVLFFGPQRN
jgi:hypothetical protein